MKTMSPKEKQNKTEKPNRQGKAFTTWFPDSVLKAIDEYIKSTHPKVSKKALIMAALKDFLEPKGFWPEEDPDDE